MPSAIDERQLLDLVRRHQPLGVGQRDRPGVHDQPLARRHALGDGASLRHEPHVALGQQALQPCRGCRRRRACRRRSASSARMASAIALIVADRMRIGDDAVLRALDGGDLRDLRRDVARRGIRGR